MKETIERRYINYLSDELSDIVDNNCDNPEILIEILDELLFRKRKIARETREKVVEILRKIKSDHFLWPTTTASIGIIDIDVIDAEEKGLLSVLGYRTGRQGISDEQRRDILDFVYQNGLPPTANNEYMFSWGEKLSSQRLQKMANCLAAFTRNAKRKTQGDYSLAISEWESDLMYLKKTYYNSRYDFEWPKINL